MGKPEPFMVYLLCVSTLFGMWKVLELLDQMPLAVFAGMFVYVVGAVVAAHFHELQRLLLRRRDSSIIRKSSTSSADAV